MTGPGSIVARRQRQRERTTAAILVAGFPEIIQAAAQCRLCAFARGTEDEQGLLRWIHEEWLAGAGVKKLEGLTAQTWLELKVSPITSRSFDRHFRNHTAFSAMVPEILPVSVLPTAESILAVSAGPAHTGMVSAVRNEPVSAADREAFGDDGSDFFDMRDIIARLRTRMTSVDETTAMVDTDGRLDSYALVLWLRLVSELRQAIEAFNRMKNSDRIAKGLLQGHTKRYVSKLSDPLVAEFDAILAFMRLGQTTAAQGALETLASERMRDILRTAAESSIKESCEAYKIH